MRVVGGEWRGRQLMAPAGRATRPTSDRVREAVFDVIGSLALSGRLSVPTCPSVPGGTAAVPAGPLAGHRVIDLYAGSGALGIEALSRGAAHCAFVENGRSALAALRANLRALGVPAGRTDVRALDVAAALESDLAEGRQYTVLFADAPYASYPQAELLLAAALPGLVPRGLAVIETARGSRVRLPLEIVSEKTYGDTRVTFLMKAAQTD